MVSFTGIHCNVYLSNGTVPDETQWAADRRNLLVMRVAPQKCAQSPEPVSLTGIPRLAIQGQFPVGSPPAINKKVSGGLKPQSWASVINKIWIWHLNTADLKNGYQKTNWKRCEAFFVLFNIHTPWHLMTPVVYSCFRPWSSFFIDHHHDSSKVLFVFWNGRDIKNHSPSFRTIPKLAKRLRRMKRALLTKIIVRFWPFSVQKSQIQETFQSKR